MKTFYLQMQLDIFLFACLREPLSDPGRVFEKATRDPGFSESLSSLISILWLSLHYSVGLSIVFSDGLSTFKCQKLSSAVTLLHK